MELTEIQKKQREEREKRNQEDIISVKDFKKLIKLSENPNSNSDMIKCSTCRKSMGIKKWARLATKKIITCPGCGATVEVGVTVKIVLKEKSRFKIESVEAGESSVEVRSDGSRLIKETVHVKVRPVVAKN